MVANIFDIGGDTQDSDSGVDIGGLLGGPRDSLIEPIVGHQAISNARNNALLNFGASMMANSGPSRMPTTVAQLVGGAAGAAQQAYQGTLDSSLKGAQQVAALRMAQLGYNRQRMLMQIAASLAGGQMSGAGGQGQAGIAGSSAPGIGGSGGGAGYGSIGAGGGGAGLQPVGATNAAVAGTSPGVSKGLLNAMTFLDPEHQAAYQNIYERDNPALIVAPDGTVINPHDQSQIGAQHGAVGEGYIRDANGNVVNAPGFLGASAQRGVQQKIIDATTDTVPVQLPSGEIRQVPKLQALGLTMGPNGPQLNLGGSGYTSSIGPAAIAEQEGDVKQFLTQRQQAVDKASAATDALRQYDQLNDLLPSISTGAGANAQIETANLLNRLGLISGEGQDRLNNMVNFKQGLTRTALSTVKSIFPQRVSNYETQSVLKTFSTIEDPKQSIQFNLDTLRASQQAQQEKADFYQNYSGPRGKAEQAYEQSEQGKKGLGDYPVMWRNFPIDQPKPGTKAAAEGVVRVNIPGGRKVFAVPDGRGGYLPYGGQ